MSIWIIIDDCEDSMPTKQSAADDALSRVLADLDGKLFATVPETSVVFRADERAIRRMIAAGEIPATRTGRVWRIPVRWIREAAGLGE